MSTLFALSGPQAMKRTLVVSLLVALCACAASRDARPTLGAALPADVVERVKALRDPELTSWLATTDFDEGSIDAVHCRLGLCTSCFHALQSRPARARDQQWIDAWAPRCEKADPCVDAVPSFRAREELSLAATMAPKDPVDACEHFRNAQRSAGCRPDSELELGAADFLRSFPRACLRADLFAADPEVRAARARLEQASTELERDELRALLDRKRIEYRER